jgi:hypothetical protein
LNLIKGCLEDKRFRRSHQPSDIDSEPSVSSARMLSGIGSARQNAARRPGIVDRHPLFPNHRLRIYNTGCNPT